MGEPGTRAAHITVNGTTALVDAGEHGRLHRVVVGKSGTAGTVTLQTPGGGIVYSIIEVASAATQGSFEFDLDLRVGGLEAVAAAFVGVPSVTVIY